jgi:hypothetical protein
MLDIGIVGKLQMYRSRITTPGLRCFNGVDLDLNWNKCSFVIMHVAELLTMKGVLSVSKEMVVCPCKVLSIVARAACRVQ